MANWVGTNPNTGAVELPKYNAAGVTQEMAFASVGTALALNDVIIGPVVQAGQAIIDVVAAPDDLDSAVSPLIQFNVGYINSGTYTASAFLKAGNTTAGTSGIARMDVAAAYGTIFTNNVTIAAKISAAAGTATAGVFRLGVLTTSSP